MAFGFKGRRERLHEALLAAQANLATPVKRAHMNAAAGGLKGNHGKDLKTQLMRELAQNTTGDRRASA